METQPTIFALATGPAAAALAILRVSGPAAGAAVQALTGVEPPQPRCLSLRRLIDPQSGETVDQGLVAWFRGPDSATGEDVAEFHIHGGRAVAEALITAVARVPGLRLAEPGEFTRRAFEHGKLDLTQAEAVADLVAASTAAQRRQALGQLDGTLGALYERWRATLIAALSRCEAAIDFADDDDVPATVTDGVREDLQRLIAEMTAHLDDGRRGEIVREGYEIVLLGPPNAGKSSLLNRLSGRDVAIVSQTAGTTRDVIEVSMNLKGYPVILADTAGIRAADDSLAQVEDSIEREGIRRAHQRARSAELKVIVLDSTSIRADSEALLQSAPDALVVLNKADLAPDATAPAGREAYRLSALTGEGVDSLVVGLARRAAAALGGEEAPTITRARHRAALENCLGALHRAADPGVTGNEVVAEELRAAAQALGRITGRVDVEDVLDRIFADFCIGK